MAAPLRYLGVHIHHPGGQERASNPDARARVWIGAATDGGHAREIPLTEADLFKLVRDGAKYLAILHGVRS